MSENIINPGTSFIDLSTFYSVQKLIDNPEILSEYQILDLCSFLDCLILSNKISVIKPIAEFESVTPVSYPAIMNELSSKGIKIEKIPYNEQLKIDDIILSYASEIFQDEEQMNFFKEFGSTFDISGYYLKYFTDESNKQLINKLEEKGFSLSDGSIFGLGHHYRSCNYLQLSCSQGLPYFPHFIREPIISRAIKFGGYQASRNLLSKVFLEKTENIDKKLRDEINQLINIQNEKLRFPAIPTLILSQCNGVEDILDETINFYKQNDAIKYRNYMEKYEEAIFKNDMEKITKYRIELDDFFEVLEQQIFDGVEIFSIPVLIIEYLKSSMESKSLLELIYAILKFGYEVVTSSGEYKKIFNRRQLSFLGKVARNYGEIKSSKNEFERVFNKEIDIQVIHELRTKWYN